ncbi:Tyrosine-protein phosphatase non-receptor type 14 [Blomia tropicalis]|nr:Tyrosine-protein phosphatase non-receptor type 14 [Blomia tropicalis]
MPFYFRLGKRSQQYNVANKDLFVIPIELLTNECIECTLLSTSIGQECLNNVCQKIGLQQPEYFGLLFKSRKNVDQWVDLNKPLKKQLDKYTAEVRLYFRLQYFVPNFHFLFDEISRYHYFCAMKGLVIDGRIACSRDDAILLASFSLQAEFGDYSPERHTVEYLNNFALFPKSMVTSKIARDVLVECAINAYRNLQGVPTNVAEIYYISEAQQREGYGQEGFPAKDMETGQDVCLGVCIRGIFVINTEANTVELFKWNDIANLIHQKKMFTIERNVENYRKSYSTFDSDYASCIWRICVEQHQYFMKGIQSSEIEQTSDQAQSLNAHLVSSGKDLFLNQLKQFSPIVDSYSSSNSSRPVSSLYETIPKNRMVSSPSPPSFINVGSDQSIQEYNLNGHFEKKSDQNHMLKKRSSTDPIELHHITVNCPSNGNGAIIKSDHVIDGDYIGQQPLPQQQTQQTQSRIKNVPSHTPSPLNMKSSQLNSSTPIYENQLNSNDLTFEQRKKLLPSYKSPPDYESFIKRKYTAMAHLSQSLSSIPSRLASHNQINSSSSSSSLVNPFLNATTLVGGNGNHGGTNGHAVTSTPLTSMSTTSVPYLLQQRQPIFLSNVYRNYADLSNLDLEKQSMAANNKNHRGSLPQTESAAIIAAATAVNSHQQNRSSVVLNQLHYQKQKMQSSGMFTASSPELNNLNLFQKRTVQQSKNNDHSTPKSIGTARHYDSNESNNLKGLKSIPHYFASVPDLTFQTTTNAGAISAALYGNHFSGIGVDELINNDYKKFTSQQQVNRTKSSLFNFGAASGKNNNAKVFRSQNNTGSEPNLFNESTNTNCYKLQRSKLSVEHLNNLQQQHQQQKSNNSITMLESQQQSTTRLPFSYSISNKIDETPELMVANKSEEYAQSNQLAQQHHRQSNAIYANLHSTSTVVPASISTIHQAKPCLEGNQSKQLNIPGQSLSSTLIPVNHSNTKQFNNFVNFQQQQHQPKHSLDHISNHQSKLTTKVNSEQHSTETTATMSKNLVKNSRIIVFDKSFEDQDFTREFELLPRMNPTAKFTTASLAENILKNRFRDILPYEENRVKLTPTKDNKHGYINASHVHMKFGTMNQHYIAAQGPLPTTTLDFWQMVFEQNISLIVMVTNFTESGAQKCYTYLPLSNEPGKNMIRFGDFEIICNYTTISLTFITSFLTLNYNGQKRTITHLRYTDWHDHSIPGDLQGFLSFLSEMDALYRRNFRDGSGFGRKRTGNQSGASVNNGPPPILVHCSAGAGRSGVVILCDALLKCLDHNFSEPIDIPRSLIQLRFQRMISVQHCEQFRFVCQVLSQYLSNSRLI